MQSTAQNQNKWLITYRITEPKSSPLLSGLSLGGTFQATLYKMPLPLLRFRFPSLDSTCVLLAFARGSPMEAGLSLPPSPAPPHPP